MLKTKKKVRTFKENVLQHSNIEHISWHTSMVVPQVLRDIVPRMWVSLDVREQVGSRSCSQFWSMPSMEALLTTMLMLLSSQMTFASP